MTDPHHQYDQPWLDENGDPHASVPKDNYERSAELIRIVDGDTLELRLDMGGAIYIKDVVRLAWCDTPEKWGGRFWERPAGLLVSEKVEEWFGDQKNLTIRSLKFATGKYGRYICEVYCGDRCLNHWLVKQGYAWPVDKDGKIIGIRDIDLLTGVPEAVREKVKEREPKML